MTAFWRQRMALMGLVLAMGCGNGPNPIDYLGQTPPSQTPQIFAPGIVSSDQQEHSTLAVAPDGQSMYWSRWPLPRYRGMKQTIYRVTLQDGQWSDPEVAPFSGVHSDGSPTFSPDGQRLYFCSERPWTSGDALPGHTDIWYVEQTQAGGWSEPTHLGFTDRWESGMSFNSRGDLYFSAGYQVNGTSDGSVDLFVSGWRDGRHQPPQRLESPLSTDAHRDAFPCVAPDGRFLIFNRDTRRFTEDGRFLDGRRTLMVSFKQDNGTWGDPVSMGPLFNDKGGRFPGLSPDGRYLFFTRYTQGRNEDIYWVDASVIETLRAESTK